MANADHVLVGVVMGSRSDWETMQHAVKYLEQFNIAHEVQVVSAHRTPDLLFSYAQQASERGLRVIIAGAGGAAHLAGVIAAHTPLPTPLAHSACGSMPVSRRPHPSPRRAARRRGGRRLHPPAGGSAHRRVDDHGCSVGGGCGRWRRFARATGSGCSNR